MAAILFSLLFYISIPIFISIYALLYFLRFILYFFNIQNGRHSKMAAILKISNSTKASSHWDLFLWKVSLRFLKRCSRNASDNEKAGRRRRRKIRNGVKTRNPQNVVWGFNNKKRGKNNMSPPLRGRGHNKKRCKNNMSPPLRGRGHNNN